MSGWTSIKKPARSPALIPQEPVARVQTERRDAEPLARILWHLLKYQQPYDPSVWAKAEAKLKEKKIKRLQQNAAALGFKLLTAS